MRRRNVTCSRDTGVACDPQKKPLSVGSCHIQDCPKVVDNFETDWSGSGWSSNDVLNEINSIPEVKPPPKFSTTRAQPRSQNDLNHVVEGDFHYHNNIENVKVDDFYYDYNFINFHEDLSDDFEDDGRDSGHSNSVSTPREAGPTGSTGRDRNTATTTGPAAATVISPVSRDEEQLDKDVDRNGKDDEDESESVSENLEDFLSEDFLLPAFTTRLPPFSPTQFSPTQKENENPRPSEKSATTLPLWTDEDPTITLQNGTETGKKSNFFHKDGVTAPPTLGYHITVHSAVISTEQEGIDGPKATTHLQLDISELPQTTSQPAILPAAFTPADSSSDLTELVYSTVQDPRESSRDLSRNLPPASEKSGPVPTSSQHISGNGEASRDPAPTGTDAVPPTLLEGATTPPPADSLPAPRERQQTESPPLNRTGFDRKPQPPANPTTLKPSQANISFMLHEAPPTRPPDPRPVQATSSTQTSTSTQVVTSAYWVTGNWSTVSLCLLHVLQACKAVCNYAAATNIFRRTMDMHVCGDS